MQPKEKLVHVVSQHVPFYNPKFYREIFILYKYKQI